MTPRPPTPTVFPYTTLFRSVHGRGEPVGDVGDRVRLTRADVEDAAQVAWRLERQVACRSEEHTSELQSRPHLVCRLLLEKKKKQRRERESARVELKPYRSHTTSVTSSPMTLHAPAQPPHGTIFM